VVDRRDGSGWGGLCRTYGALSFFFGGSRPLRDRAIVVPCLTALICSGRAIWAEWLNFGGPAPGEPTICLHGIRFDRQEPGATLSADLVIVRC